MIEEIPWSAGNFILLIAVLIYVMYFWYKQPFRGLERLLNEVRDREIKSRLIGDSLLEAIIIATDNGVITEFNKAASRIFGYEDGSLKGMNVVNIVPDKYKQRHLEGIKRAVEGGQTHILGKTIDIEGLRKDGTIVPIALSITRVSTSQGQFFTAVIRDISDRYYAQEKIAQLNQALETRLAAMEAFSQTVSHDLNAPLRTIEGFSEIIEQDYTCKLDEQGRDFIRRIRRGVLKMRQLIKDMMRLARVTQAETDLNISNVSLSDIFRSIFSENRMADPVREIETNVADNMNVNADPELLVLAINNLVSNAWKYTKFNPKPVIEVGCKTLNGEKVYYICDNGVGFDQSKVSLLFQPFKRLHTEKEFEGSGIGLTIVKRVIELHKGRVWAEGIIGKGATFYFTIGT